MLTEGSYQSALWVYALAAIAALAMFNLWFLPRAARWRLRVALTLPLAALLLTPASIAPGADTLAPALVVAAFQWLGEGREAAIYALRLLGLSGAVALLLAVALPVAAARMRKRRER